MLFESLGYFLKLKLMRRYGMCRLKLNKMDLSQYGFKKIRDFLIVNDQDIRLVVDLIIRDIKWRNLYVPISQSDILMMEKSNKIKLTSIDGEIEP